MTYQVIGTCSLCGGPVQIPRNWMGVSEPEPSCGKCGASKAQPNGPVIEMRPKGPWQIDRSGAKVYRSYADYCDD